MHSVVLNEDSPRYMRIRDEMSNYYYEAIRMNVTETGEYTLFTESDINTYGYIYFDTFDPKNPSTNQKSKSYGNCGGLQFKFVIQLHINTTYVLVVTTFLPNETGRVPIVALGPSNIIFKRLCEYISTI